MATTIDGIEVLIKANAASFESEMKAVKRGLKQLELESEKAAKATKGMSAGMVAVSTAIGQVIGVVLSQAVQSIGQSMDAAVSRLDTLNNFPRVMSNLGISAQDAEKALKLLDAGITGLPTTLDSAANAVQRLVSANGNIAASTDMYLALNDAILAGGAGAEAQAAAMEQMIQAYSKGKPEATEWRSILVAMPAQLKQVATAMGYTSTAIGGDLHSAIMDGKISMDDLMKAIMKLDKEGVEGFGSFREQAFAATGGVATGIANLNTAITRGITNVMAVIGQANIAKFFNNFTKAINAAFVYVAAFVKVIKEAIAWTSAFFGGSGSTDSMVQETNKAAESMGGVAANAGNTTDNINDAAGAAKKLQKQLAGFDEMNVLTEKDSGGGSSSAGAGAGGAGGGLSDFTWDNKGADEGVNKIEEAVGKIKGFFNDLFSGVDFTKVFNAFKQLGEDIDKFLTPAKQILGDIWENYIKKFIEWEFNDFLPAFFNLLGGAIQLVGAVISNVWNTALKPFIDNFLVPIAQFTGGIIVSMLNGIGNAFRAIAGNSSAVEVLSAAVKIFIALAGAKLASGIFTSIAGSCSSALASLKTTIGYAISDFKGLFSGVASPISGVQIAIAGLVLLVQAVYNGFTKWKEMDGTAKVLTVVMGIVGAALIALGVAIGLGFSAATLGIGAVVAGVVALIALTAGILLQKEAILSTAEATEKLKEAQEAVNNANDTYISTIDRLTNAQNNLKKVQEETGLSGQALFEQVEKGALSYANMNEQQKMVYKAYVEEQNAQRESEDATKKLIEAKKEEQNASFDNQLAIAKEKGNYDEYKAAVIDAYNKGELSADEAREKIEKAMSEMSDSSRETFMEDLPSDVKEGMEPGRYTTAGQEMERFFANTWENIKKPFSEAGEWFKGKFTEAWAKIKEAFSGAWQWAQDRWGDIKNAFSNAFEEFKKIGQNIWGGIKEGIGNIAQKGKDLFGGMVNGIKSFLGIHSPSRLFAGIGGFVGEGFANGVMGEASGVKAAFEQLIPDANLFSDVALPEFSAKAREFSLNENLDVTERPIQLLLKIDGESIPISATRITESLNETSFLNNRNLLTI